MGCRHAKLRKGETRRHRLDYWDRLSDVGSLGAAVAAREAVSHTKRLTNADETLHDHKMCNLYSLSHLRANRL